MKKLLKYLFLVFILTSCKKKNNLQYEKLYGDVKEVLISDYSNLTDTNDYLKGQKSTIKNKYIEGKLITSEIFNSNNNKVIEQYIYNSENVLVQKKVYLKENFNTKMELYSVEKYEYLSSDKILGIDSIHSLWGGYESTFYKSPRNQTNLYTLNENGLISKVNFYSKNPENLSDSTLAYESVSQFNSYGFCVQYNFIKNQKKLNSTKKLNHITKFEFNELDKLGNWTKKTVSLEDKTYSVVFRKITYN